MTLPKFFLYKAQNANIVVILRRGETRETWELIKWDLETDTFTEGQWLLKKHMNGKYDVYGFVDGNQNYACHGVISKIPNFTAIYFNPDHCGNWQSIQFTETGDVNGPPMEKKGSVELSFVKGQTPTAPSGYIETDSWIDPKGRVITHKNGVLLADNQVLYDTTDHVFVPKEPR